MESLCSRLRAEVPAIIEDWDELARHAAWLGIPREHRIDSLPDVLDRLLCLVPCSARDLEDTHRAMVLVASEHGALRREQHCSESVLFTEHALLRQVVSRRIDGSGSVTDTCLTTVLRFDIALGVATNASLLGFHRREFSALGSWPAVLDPLTDDSPVLAMCRRVAETREH
jgi:hypothetical protein